MNARSTRFTQDEVLDLIIVGGGINGALALPQMQQGGD